MTVSFVRPSLMDPMLLRTEAWIGGEWHEAKYVCIQVAESATAN